MTSSRSQLEDLIDELQVPISKIEQHHYVHTWWTRRPASLARVLTYLSLLDGHSSEPEFLVKLAKPSPSNKIMQTALNKIRDSQWQRTWRSHTNDPMAKEIPSEPSPLRVLDPFAGSGSIPLEAMRFGCETYAGDLNPVSTLILRSTLQLPQLYFDVNPQIKGSGLNQTWNGLDKELQYWAKWVEQKALKATQSLYIKPDNRISEFNPTYYIWVNSYKCNNPACPVDYFPFPTSFVLAQLRNSKQYVQFNFENGQLNAIVKSGPKLADDGRNIACPVCRTVIETTTSLSQTRHHSSVLAVVILNSSKTKVTQYASGSPKDMQIFFPWSVDHQTRLQELIAKPFAQALTTPLVLEQTTNRNLGSKDIRTFRDLFSDRQLLVGLEFMSAIIDARQSMQDTGLLEEIIDVLSTYLSLLLGYTVEHNSRLCSWSSNGNPSSSFSRLSYHIPQLFVERAPDGFVNLWLDKVLPTLTELSSLLQAQQVYCGDAAHLSFEDNYFDAIVTDPPYYDNVPYSDLADFFWVWESSITLNWQIKKISQQNLDRTVISPKTDLEDFAGQLVTAFKECYRTLKPGGVFSILLTNRSGFEEYINYIQQAGFEIISIKRIPEELRFETVSKPQTLFVFAHKPYAHQSGQYLAANPDILAQAIDQGREKQILYSGLAALLESELEEKDYCEYKPIGAQGSKNEILMEIVALCDLPEFLEKTLGKSGLRRLANKLTLPDKDDPLFALLEYFGFNTLSPDRKLDGAKQVAEKLSDLISRIRSVQSNDDKSYIRGLFIEGSTSVERLIRQTIWGWAQIAFGREGRDAAILKVLTDSELNNMPKLERLTFGHIAKLFRELPDAIAISPATNNFRAKLGRQHVYNPKQKQTFFSKRLDELVTLRNNVEHDKDGYWSNSDLSNLIADCIKSFEQTQILIEELSKENAIPHFAVPKLEIKDQFGRVSYTIQVDNGNEISVFSTHPLKLGSSYVYFVGESNPIPVDPLLLLLDDIGPIP